MSNGYVQVFCGKGEGKTSAAIGKTLLCATGGKNAIVVKFMKKKDNDSEFLKRLEPEIKMFRFEKKIYVLMSFPMRKSMMRLQILKMG